MEKTLVVLAAGMGTRYGGLKQLDQVGPSDETIIDYSVYDAIRAGFTKVVFIIRKDIEEAFKTELSSKYSGSIKVEHVFQEISDIPDGFTVPEERKKPWGTGHAMLTAKDAVSGPFLVINADDFYGNDSYRIASEYLESFDNKKIDAALVGFYVQNTLSDYGTVSRGLCKADDHQNLTFVEEIHGIHQKGGAIESDSEHLLSGMDIVSMNMWLFSNPVFEIAWKYFSRFLNEAISSPKTEFYIPLIVNNLIAEEKIRVKVLETDSDWFGVTYKEDKPTVIAKIAELVQKGVYPEKLWE